MNQFMYTLEPIMLKKKPVLDFISGSLVNPFFRFYAGWVLFMPAFNAPWEIVLFVLGIQFGGYALYRLSSKAHEAALNYKSSIVVFGEKNIKILAYLGIALGGGGFIFACLNGTLHFKFIWLAVLSLLAAPLYLGALRDPKAMDMKKIYRLIYAHYILFITGFIALGVFV
ncbi:hypothetical protein KKH30_00555 [Candidatus Micrarchaeota archaeon]|nr:hypothetical protein [Candidatus Micrarchaeota archaeon]MBU1939234.1 hypothetical protein [Candidatus Micrarchaeota archaeon]